MEELKTKKLFLKEDTALEDWMDILKIDKETVMELLERRIIVSEKAGDDCVLYELDVDNYLKYLMDELVTMAEQELYKVVQIMLGGKREDE